MKGRPLSTRRPNPDDAANLAFIQWCAEIRYRLRVLEALEQAT